MKGKQKVVENSRQSNSQLKNRMEDDGSFSMEIGGDGLTRD